MMGLIVKSQIFDRLRGTNAIGNNGSFECLAYPTMGPDPEDISSSLTIKITTPHGLPTTWLEPATFRS